MSDDATDRAELEELVGELADTLESLQTELEAERGRRRSGLGDLLRFADEVAIPAAILVLETNVRALKLLRRSIRIAEGRPTGSGDRGAGARVEQAGEATLRSVERVLGDLQDAFEGQPTDPEARDLLADARELQAEVRERLGSDGGPAPDPAEAANDADPVAVDVESELDSIRDQVDDERDDRPD
jgi:hypothetical protein